jgi:hypothetical protein
VGSTTREKFYRYLKRGTWQSGTLVRSVEESRAGPKNKRSFTVAVNVRYRQPCRQRLTSTCRTFNTVIILFL